MVILVLAIGITAKSIVMNFRVPLVLVAVSAIFSAAGLCGIIHFTVLARTPSDTHIFMVSLDPFSNKFLREMVMNAFL